MIDIEMSSTGEGVEEYLLKNKGTLIYSSPRFVKLVASHLGVSFGWLLAKTEQGDYLGVLPFMMKNGALGPVLNSLAYYGSNGGVSQAIENEEVKCKLINAFYELAESKNCASATIITNPLLQDQEVYSANTRYDYLDERIGQISHIAAAESADEIITLFSNPRPRNIRKAIKENVTVERRQDKEALNFLYETHVQNMQAIGGLSKKKSFFDAIPTMMNGEEWAVYVGAVDGKPVVALLVFYFNNTIEYFTPVVLEEFRGAQALSLVIYTAMQDGYTNQYGNWNWGGTWLSQGGVYDFKKKWGTTDYPYFYYTKLFNKDVLKQPRSLLLGEYDGFYVLPFDALVE